MLTMSRAQIDLGRRSCAFKNNNVVRGGQQFVAFTNYWHQFFNPRLVVLAGGEVTPDLAAHNYLRMCIAGGLDQDWIHVNRSGNPRRFRL